jgi:hypothetical protein
MHSTIPALHGLRWELVNNSWDELSYDERKVIFDHVSHQPSFVILLNSIGLYALKLDGTDFELQYDSEPFRQEFLLNWQTMYIRTLLDNNNVPLTPQQTNDLDDNIINSTEYVGTLTFKAQFDSTIMNTLTRLNIVQPTSTWQNTVAKIAVNIPSTRSQRAITETDQLVNVLVTSPRFCALIRRLVQGIEGANRPTHEGERMFFEQLVIPSMHFLQTRLLY